MSQRNLITKTLLAALCAAAMAEAHSAGTTVAAAGVPGEQNCTSCHTVGTIGTGNVAVTFSGTNQTYQPGVTQHLKLTITDSIAKRWGFMLTARVQVNTQLQGGSFVPTDANTQLFCTQIGAVNYSQGTTCPSQQPLSYIEQTYAGTNITSQATGSQSYQFDWVPPTDSTIGNIVIYAAALASNNDGGVGGDITYLVRYVITPQVIPSVPAVTSVFNVSGVQSTITPGAIASIRGTALATSSRSMGSGDLINGQFPETADGVGVTIGGVPAFIVSLDPSRVDVIVPGQTGPGLTPLVVTSGGQVSASYQVDVEAVAPAFFLWKSSSKYVVARHLDGSVVGPFGLFEYQPSTPAQPGETILLTATGLGTTTPALNPGSVVPTGTSASLATAPVVLFNGAGTLANSATAVAGLAGVFTVSVQVPGSAPSGDTPIQIQVAGVQSDPGFLISIGTGPATQTVSQ